MSEKQENVSENRSMDLLKKRARFICGIFAILLLLYELFVNVPDTVNLLISGWSYLDGSTRARLILQPVFALGFYASIALWSLSGILVVYEEGTRQQQNRP
jgi:hypothetical protein